jgi:HAD superfamily hydrolase (TIGR01509 family)
LARFVGIFLAVTRPEAVVLDMDGLLIDTEPLYKSAWQLAARELGVDLDDDFYATLIGRSNAEGEVLIARRFGDALPLDVFRARWPVLWAARIRDAGMPTKPGVVELIDFLEAHRLPVAVATSSDRAFTAFSLTAAQLADRLSLRVTGDEIARGKPAPDIYLEAARRLGVDARACVAFEDSENGVLAASCAGMRVIMVPDLHQPSAAIAAIAAAVVPTLHDALPLLETWLGP